MKLQQRSNAWCVAQPKDAALFFERVHILEGALLEGYEDVEALRAHGNITVKDTLTTVEPGLFILSPVLSPVLRAMAESLFASQGKEFPPAPLSLSRDDPHYSALEALWVHVVAVRTGVSGPGTFVLPQCVGADTAGEDPAVVLSGLALVDTSTMEWRHILELRRDKKSIRKLRRLRLFMQEQYDGRDLEFVRQDLLQRIDDYNETARTWGASVCEGSLSMFLGKEARLSVAAALGAALAGMPQLSIAAAVPFLASLGQCALELRGKRRALGLELSKDPVSFVCDVKRRE